MVGASLQKGHDPGPFFDPESMGVKRCLPQNGHHHMQVMRRAVNIAFRCARGVRGMVSNSLGKGMRVPGSFLKKAQMVVSPSPSIQNIACTR